ncbi:MAG: hypothetical protein Udaeo2_20660 [Candidatus Udaeobacter sp.]|nr:MAG: hypothetical protein Udaeo2_20660 [Candidatus Udaeobacter sp.]
MLRLAAGAADVKVALIGQGPDESLAATSGTRVFTTELVRGGPAGRSPIDGGFA